jgi:hypothetical protein
MNKQWLGISLALPVLIIGAGQALANLKVIDRGNPQVPKLTPKISQVKLDTQQPSSFLISARDDQKEECEWLGICKDKK